MFDRLFVQTSSFSIPPWDDRDPNCCDVSVFSSHVCCFTHFLGEVRLNPIFWWIENHRSWSFLALSIPFLADTIYCLYQSVELIIQAIYQMHQSHWVDAFESLDTDHDGEISEVANGWEFWGAVGCWPKNLKKKTYWMDCVINIGFKMF